MSFAASLNDYSRPAPVRDVLGLAVAGPAAFGAAIGTFVGGWQIVYAALKMPLFILGTLALCMALMMALTASRLAPGEVLRIALRTVFTTSAVLLAIAPPIAVAGLSLPKPRGYPGMVLVLTASVAMAGVVSVVRLRRAVGSTPLLISWIAIYGFVGAQVAWLLKPWIGASMVADRFIPLDQNLHGNFYEAVWGVLVGFTRGAE